MFTIGELAAAAGTTTRAVRHYPRVGLLSEPARRANGYREYNVPVLLRLVRISRLTSVWRLPLPDVGAALAGEDERDLRNVLVKLAEELERQEATVRGQREWLVSLLSRAEDLLLPSASPEVLQEFRRLVPHGSLGAEASQAALSRAT